MIEYGSDFHYVVPSIGNGNSLYDFFPSANLYADGRQALIHLYHFQGWQRLWVPEYYCYEVIESLKQAGLNLIFYSDWPSYHGDSRTLEAIQRNGHLKHTDAILRVNYFGLRAYRSEQKLSVAAIVEDHTHDLIGDWAFHSTADWCIASLRKSLPIPEGGILWSPEGLPLPTAPKLSDENERIATTRWEAMKLKSRYLAGEAVVKDSFRKGYIDTEDYFDTSSICSLDKASQNYLKSFDIRDWYSRKMDNWNLLHDIHKDGLHIVYPESESCYPFSLVLLFDFLEERDRVRKELIEQQIYPAVLWKVPAPIDGEVYKFSYGMLSIHCDARYTRDEILEMKSIIESII